MKSLSIIFVCLFIMCTLVMCDVCVCEKQTLLGESFGKSKGIVSVKYDMIINDESNDINIVTKTWIKDKKMKTESTIEGITIITIIDGNISYIYTPQENMAMKTVIEELPESAMTTIEDIDKYKPIIVGTEKIDNKLCDVFEYTDEDGKTKVWMWKKHNFPIRIKSNTMIIDYKNIRFGNIDDNVFELPAGVEIIDLSDIMKSIKNIFE